MDEKIILNEVGPRDWRFSHRESPDTLEVLKSIGMLEDAGIKRVEIGASVNYNKYPYMSDTFELLGNLRKNPSENAARYSVYVGPYRKNYPGDKIKSLLDEGLLKEDPGMPEELSFSISASESRNMEIYGLTGNQVFEHIKDHVRRARQDGVKFFRGYVSSVFGYKNSNDCPLGNVVGWTQMLLDLGCYEVALGDSRGNAHPSEFKKKWSHIKRHLPLERLAMHFHEDYYATWETDVVFALLDGVRVFDTSIMDFLEPVKSGEKHAVVFDGNIPPNASTEKMVYFIEQQINSSDYPFREIIGKGSLTTGLDYEKIKLAGDYIREKIRMKASRRQQ